MKYIYAVLLMVVTMGHSWADEADCDDMLIAIDGSYDVKCEADNVSQDDARAKWESLTAVSRDGSHFVVAAVTMAGNRTYITDRPLSQTADTYLPNHKDTKTGRSVADGIDVLETQARVYGTDQNCLVFRKHGHRFGGGWNRINSGIICTKGDIGVAYDALAKLKLPS